MPFCHLLCRSRVDDVEMRKQFFRYQECGGKVSGAVEDGSCVVDCAVDASGDLFDEELTCLFFKSHAREQVIEAVLNAERRVQVGKNCRILRCGWSGVT